MKRKKLKKKKRIPVVGLLLRDLHLHTCLENETARNIILIISSNF